jgi:LAO/AO transport system kinase
MATRGQLGGLARATSDGVTVMEAMGKDIIIIETVGVGQDEVEVVKHAHTTVLVLIPGMGDETQAMKAGVMEIADCFVMNKADREGVERAITHLRSILDLKDYGEGGWRPPIVSTIAPEGEGLGEVIEIVDRHLEHLVATEGLGKFRLEKSRADFMAVLQETLSRYVLEDLLSDGDLEKLVESIAQRKTDPYTAAEEILTRLRG